MPMHLPLSFQAMDITHYQTIVFDCDGVILDSNPLKIQAYRDTAIHLGYSEEQAQALVKYHIELGGISRYHKFEYFLREIVGGPVDKDRLQALIAQFSYEVKQALIHCEMAKGLHALRKATPQAGWMLVSGGDQAEKREVFAARGIAELFDAGIFGSPDYKDDILSREATDGRLKMPGLFVGDSRYDHEAAIKAGLDFVFLSAWTDVEGWQEYCASHNIRIVERLSDLIPPP
jgi:phosphoglycolate phosphatase-like HAD superfamily hydrolase